MNQKEKSDYSFEESDESETKENYKIAVDFLEQVGNLIHKIKNESFEI